MSRLTAALRSWTGFPRKRNASDAALQSDINKILANLTGKELEILRNKYPNEKWTKYLDISIYVPVSVRVCATLNLIDRSPQRILDIGCGTGLFLYCARYFGHRGIGIDIDNNLLGEMAQVLGVDRRIEPVRPFVPISEMGTFDLITAMGTLFDRSIPKIKQRRWQREEWHFLLADLEKRLTSCGRVFLRINRGSEARERELDYYDERLFQALRHGYLGGISFLLDRSTLRLAIHELSRA